MRIFAMTTTRFSGEYTGYAIESFFRSAPLAADEHLIVIDNDRNSSEVRGISHPRIEVIVNELPQSFAANANMAMRRAAEKNGDLFFLNNDLIFPNGWLEPLVAVKHAVTSPISNRELQIRSSTILWKNALELSDYVGREAEFSHAVDAYRASKPHPHRVMTLPFFCIRIPFSAYSVVGPFDESFGPGGAEDNDYCLRCCLENIPILYAAPAYVLHFSGRSTWAGAETKTQTEERCAKFREVFRQKWGPRLLKICVDGDASDVNRDPELRALAQKGDFKSLVSRMMS